MSSKRQATTVLTHDNWDNEEEPEERGTFRTASENELKNRVIKKARRKITGTDSGSNDDNTDGATQRSIFSGFSGFAKNNINTGTGSSSPFSFLSKIPAVASAAGSSISDTNTIKPAPPMFSFGASGTTTTTTNKGSDEKKDTSNETHKGTDNSKKTTNYYAKLKGLNQAVSDWIKTHVDKNPLCILTPIFKDYEKYISDIEKEETTNTNVSTSGTTTAATPLSSKPATTSLMNFKFSATPSSSVSTAPTSASNSTFSFGTPKATNISTTNSSIASSASMPTSIFGNIAKPTPTTTSPPKANGFSFGIRSDEKSSDVGNAKPAGFSFAPGVGQFSFGNIKPPAANTESNTASNADDDEDEEPPKVEFKQVVEDDAVYSKKCKVFVKKDGNFADRGVGTLYLKPVKDSEKTQLLVRADTNLGNILVNLILSSAIPAQRMGKNNVMMVCVPTPDVDKPTPMLLRVKTGEEADELLETIEKYKK